MIKWGMTFQAGTACLAVMCALLFLAPNIERVSGGKRYGPFLPKIIDGDTLDSGTDRFRLIGVDACEMGQPIWFPDHENALNCGYYARAFVAEFVGDREVVCYGQGDRSYDRVVARCFVGTAWPTAQTDIGAFAIHSGWAVPTEHAGASFKLRYLMEYLIAKLARRGAWNGSSALPAVWRATE